MATKLTDDPTKLETNLRFLKVCGLYINKSEVTLAEKIYSFAISANVLIGIIHFALKIVIESEQMESLSLFEALHWLILYTSVLTFWIIVARSLDNLVTLHTYIINGFYKDETLSQNHLIIRNKGNSFVIFLRKFYVTALTIAVFLLPSREPLLGNKTWNLPFPGWFPFEINSKFRYTIALVYQVMSLANLFVMATPIILLYVAFTTHLSSELKILQLTLKTSKIAVKDDKRESSTESSLVVQHENYLFLRKCAIHHVNISKYFDILQRTYSPLLLNVVITTTLSVAILGLIVIDPGKSIYSSMMFGSLFVPEIVVSCYYCWSGEQISNESIGVQDVLYQSFWYKLPKRTQYYILMILIRTQKGFVLNGARMKNFTLEGLTDILGGIYTYFNLLLVLKSKLSQ